MIGIVFGGDTIEREGSIISATDVARSLDRSSIDNILIDFSSSLAIDNMMQVDFVFNSVHGKNGEDGEISRICDNINVPHNFSGEEAHQTCYNKPEFKNYCQKRIKYIKYPLTITSQNKDITGNTQVVIKPIYGGGSLGIIGPLPLTEALKKTIHLDEFAPYYIEEFIQGRFVSYLKMNNSSEDEFEILEIEHNSRIYDYDTKHNSNMSKYKIPASVSITTTKNIYNFGTDIWGFLNFKDAVRFDFIVDKLDEVYLLEANTVPGLSRQGNMAAIWLSKGGSYDNLIKKLSHIYE